MDFLFSFCFALICAILFCCRLIFFLSPTKQHLLHEFESLLWEFPTNLQSGEFVIDARVKLGQSWYDISAYKNLFVS
ncbi:hypothetical protein NC652_003762 [Populus alba x Populus x berolinensis]|nr:hypothetical protein NC652_003762 [Populus alba x Populus x berolinensis]